MSLRIARTVLVAFLFGVASLSAQTSPVTALVDFENFTGPIPPNFGDGTSYSVIIPRPDGSYWESYSTRLLRAVPSISGADPTTVIGVAAGLHYGGLAFDVYPVANSMSFLLVNAGPSDDFKIHYNTASAINQLVTVHVDHSGAGTVVLGAKDVYSIGIEPAFSTPAAQGYYEYYVDNISYSYVPPIPQKKDGDDPPTGTVMAPERPEEATDTRIVVDNGPGLDTQCTYRDGGPLIINVPISRYVGATDGTGSLVNPKLLKDNGFLSNTAVLTLTAYDVDPEEKDNIYFNDNLLGQLHGVNNAWMTNQFRIPIEQIHFGVKGSSFSTTPGQNTIRIDIDTASGSSHKWCTSVDWVQLEFHAIAPILFVHGTASNSGTWDDVDAYMKTLGMPYSRDINLGPNGDVKSNGFQLSTEVDSLATGFGADRVHLIAHSKGGNDSREYILNDSNPAVKVLSLGTLSTGFEGTILADILEIMKITGRNVDSPDGAIERLVSHWVVVDGALWVLQDPELYWNTTYALATYNNHNKFPSGVKLYNVAADADLNNDGIIELNEVVGIGSSVAPDAPDAMYHVLGSVQDVVVRYIAAPGAKSATPMIFAAQKYPSFVPNDLVINSVSAHYPTGVFLGLLNAWHVNMKADGVRLRLLPQIQGDFPMVEP